MVQALAKPDGLKLRPRPVKKHCGPRRVRAAPATFSIAVMVWIRWKAWKTMPIRRPRKVGEPVPR